MSMRSNNGPDTRDRYRLTTNGPHEQLRRGSPKYPHGHPCVAILPCHAKGPKTANQGLPNPTSHLRRPPEGQTAHSRPHTERDRQKNRGQQNDHLQLGEEQGSSGPLTDPEDHPIPGVPAPYPKPRSTLQRPNTGLQAKKRNLSEEACQETRD